MRRRLFCNNQTHHIFACTQSIHSEQIVLNLQLYSSSATEPISTHFYSAASLATETMVYNSWIKIPPLSQRKPQRPLQTFR